MPEVDKSEKITINVGLVDLGQIDLLVDEGFYANRTDFIRTAIRRQIDSRAQAVSDTVARRALVLGTQHLSRGDLEGLRDAGQMVELRVLGLATIAKDVEPRARAGDHRLGRRPRRFSGPARGQGSSCEAYDQVARHNGADRPVDVNITPRRGLPWMTTAPRACLKHSGSPAQGSWRRRSRSCSARSGPHRPPGRSAPARKPPGWIPTHSQAATTARPRDGTRRRVPAGCSTSYGPN